jgi:hypothetical protein
MANPAGAAAAVRGVLKQEGSILLVEPWAGRTVSETIGNLFGAFYSGVSIAACMQCSKAHGGPALGAVVPESVLETYWNNAGFSRFDRVVDHAPMHRIFHVRI